MFGSLCVSFGENICVWVYASACSFMRPTDEAPRQGKLWFVFSTHYLSSPPPRLSLNVPLLLSLHSSSPACSLSCKTNGNTFWGGGGWTARLPIALSLFRLLNLWQNQREIENPYFQPDAELWSCKSPSVVTRKQAKIMKCNADASTEGLIGDAGQIKLKKEQRSVFLQSTTWGNFFFFLCSYQNIW